LIGVEEGVFTHDLSLPEYNPPDCPAWAKECVPKEIDAFRGRNGLPEVYRERRRPIGITVRGIDRYHANQFVVYRPETAHYLYHDYTPLEIGYPKGSLPSYEALAESCTSGVESAKEKVMALLRDALPKIPHPDAPPYGRWVEGDRNLLDEPLLESGVGWCNEQARAFVRLCQVLNIPARLIQQFYSDEQTGHCVAEFYAEGKWCMADATWWCLFPDRVGCLLSSAECHDSDEGRRVYARVHRQRVETLLAMSDEELRFRSGKHAAEWRQRTEVETEEFFAARLNCFGVINYPLPDLA
jgi:hypothetical protein